MSDSFDKHYWEHRYRHAPGHAPGRHDRRPSPHLVSEVAGLAPGTALEAGCGEGANAIWLAEQGWRVTAVDIAATALDRARQYADALGAEVADRIGWVEADLTAMPLRPGGFDLVTAHYVHPDGPFDELVRRLAESVKPGGTLVVVGHDPTDAHSRAHAPGDAAFDAQQLAAWLDPEQWHVEVAETRVRVHEAHGVTMHDAVLRARRARDSVSHVEPAASENAQ